MYDCMRSESESELGNQLKGILRKANKQKTDIHRHRHASMHVCMYDCLRSESESASHSSPPQLKGVIMIPACACASVLTAVVHAHKVDKQKTDTSKHMSQAYKQQCFQRQKRKEISPHASTYTRAYMCPISREKITNKIKIHTHRHTSMHVCVHECLKSSYTCVKHKYDCAFTE